MAKSRNIKIIKNFEELNDEINFEDYNNRNNFSLLCELIPNKEEERLDIIAFDEAKMSQKGLVYIFVIGGKIFKIGETTTNIKKRISSYNCGKTEYRISGTNSTTNYFVLQSLLNIGMTVKVYAFFPPTATFTIFGKTVESSEAPSKYAERFLNKDFIEKYNKKPIGCTQK